MTILIERRALLRGLFAAPAIVAAANIMPIRSIDRFLTGQFGFKEFSLGYYCIPAKMVNTIGNGSIDHSAAFLIDAINRLNKLYPAGLRDTWSYSGR